MYLDKFEWAVCTDGYEVERSTPTTKVGQSKGLMLPLRIRPKSNRVKTYRPYQKTKNLHWKFGGLNETEEDVLSFVSDYGLLGISDTKNFETLDEIIFYKRLVENLRNRINKDDLQEAAKIFNRSVGPNLTTEIDRIAGRAIYQIYPVPRNLLSYMWLSFAVEITDGRAWQKCAACDESYPIGKNTGGTKRKLYCSDACKMKTYRQRKKRNIRI